MKVNCLHCGHRFDLGNSYDDYDGLVRCATCGGLLSIVSQDGSLKRCNFAQAPPLAAPLPQRSVSADASAEPRSIPIGHEAAGSWSRGDNESARQAA